jgi:hypothetical protein
VTGDDIQTQVRKKNIGLFLKWALGDIKLGLKKLFALSHY